MIWKRIRRMGCIICLESFVGKVFSVLEIERVRDFCDNSISSRRFRIFRVVIKKWFFKVFERRNYLNNY